MGITPTKIRGSKFLADMHNYIWCPIYIPSFMIIGSVVSEELQWQDFGMARQTDGRTDGGSDCTPRPAFAFGDAGNNMSRPWIEVIQHQSREQVLYFYSTLKYCRYGVKHYPINQSILPWQQNIKSWSISSKEKRSMSVCDVILIQNCRENCSLLHLRELRNADDLFSFLKEPKSIQRNAMTVRLIWNSNASSS